MKKPPRHLPDAVHEDWHLGRTRTEALFTEIEFVMMRFQQAFERWVLHVTARAGDPAMSFPEAVLLHSVRLQNLPCTTQSIARLLNRDDIANVQYSLRKLVRGGYLAHAAAGAKSNTFTLTERGRQLTDRYAQIRNEVLVTQARNPDSMEQEFGAMIDRIGILTGRYDEAMRKATTYKFRKYGEPESR